MYPKSNNTTRASFDGCILWRCGNKRRNKTYIIFEDTWLYCI